MSADTDTPPPPRARGSLIPLTRAFLARAVCLIVANAAALLLIRLLTHHTPVHVQWWAQVAAAAAMLVTSLFVAAHQQLYWHRPARRLAELLPLVSENEAAIEELTPIRGGLAPVVAEVQETLRELRRQRAEFNRLECEMRDRIANRTDALERSLGALRQQANRDKLTGLLNRRSLEESLPDVLARCRADGAPLTVMMGDVDHFKPLNDTLGHAAGDDFLRSLGQLVRSTLRTTDLAFRYGGDEFVLLLPDTTRDEARAIADRLVHLVDALTRLLPVAHPPRLSVGVLALADAPHATAPELLDAADRLLYAIKAERKGKRPPRAA